MHPKLGPQLERRRTAIREGGIDWGHAEALAFGSLLADGIAIRMTGQDTERGTFSHRHLVLHDVHTGERYTPMQHLADSKARFEVHNSPLSEAACLGFEYGYSVTRRNALVIWEAQFGDFANGAQVMIDQFIASGRSKWGVTSRLTLFLPHGYEGNGPEHSSARLERFLQLAADDNLRIANVTTPAQLYHLLRRQAAGRTRRPLVVMTPKGLLRLKESLSSLADLTDVAFQPIIDDPDSADWREDISRLVLCSGRLYYDLQRHAERASADEVAIARIEQLYPFPTAELTELLAGYTGLKEIVWAQEEPAQHGRLALGAPPRRGRRAAGRAPQLRGPPLARQPVRGLHLGALPRAGPHRAGRSRTCRCRPPDAEPVRQPIGVRRGRAARARDPARHRARSCRPDPSRRVSGPAVPLPPVGVVAPRPDPSCRSSRAPSPRSLGSRVRRCRDGRAVVSVMPRLSPSSPTTERGAERAAAQAAASSSAKRAAVCATASANGVTVRSGTSSSSEGPGVGRRDRQRLAGARDAAARRRARRSRSRR